MYAANEKGLKSAFYAGCDGMVRKRTMCHTNKAALYKQAAVNHTKTNCS